MANTAPQFDLNQPFDVIGGEQAAAVAPTFDPNQSFEVVGSDNSPSWGNVALGAVANAPSSAANIIGGLYQTVRHPIDTISNLYSTAAGGWQELADKAGITIPGLDKVKDEAQFDALKQYYVRRYGSADGFKRALMNDPVGVAADASILLTGAGGALARAGGMAGKVGNIAAKAGELTNPLSAVTLPMKAAGKVVKPVFSAIGKLGTYTGATPLELGYDAGKQAAQGNRAPLDALVANMTDAENPADVVDTMKGALQTMKQARNQQYQQAMAEMAKKSEADQASSRLEAAQYNARAEDSGLQGNKEAKGPLSPVFADIDAALSKSNKVKNFQGVDLDPATAQIRSDISNQISDWKGMDANTFHTAEGFDALKQKIGNFAQGLQIGTPARLVADQAYRAVKAAIVKNYPVYSDIMKNYSDASDQIREIEAELSVKPNANVGTALRKLQATMRNNVSTGYGYRQDLMNTLAKNGAPNLPYQVAGQALRPWSPRGLGGVLAGADVLSAISGGKVAQLAALPLMSPRLMGNLAITTGKAAGYLSKLPPMGRAATGLYAAGLPQRPQSYLSGN